jgi:tricorn protease
VDRRRHLLQLGPRRHPQPLLVRPGPGAVASSPAATTWDVRWPSADPATGPHRLRAGRRAAVYDTREGGGRPAIPVFVPRRRARTRGRRGCGGGEARGLRAQPEGRAGAVRGPRRRLHRAHREGPTRNLTRTSGAHDKHARWSPDGKQDRVRLGPHRRGRALAGRPGRAASRSSSRRAAGHALRPRVVAGRQAHSPSATRTASSSSSPSPDRKVVEIADDERTFIRDYAWSPEGGHLAFSMPTTGLALAPRLERRRREDSAGSPASSSPRSRPAWDPTASYLFYLSDRDFAPQISGFEWNYATNRTTGIYALTLKKDGKSPFPPQSDEVTTGGEEGRSRGRGEGGREEGEEKKPDEKKPRRRSGSTSRASAPASPACRSRATTSPAWPSGKGHLLYTVAGAPFYGRDSYHKPALKLYSLKDRKESTLAENVGGWALSATARRSSSARASTTSTTSSPRPRTRRRSRRRA